MRTSNNDAALASLVSGTAQRPYMGGTVQDSLLRFSQVGYAAPSGWDTDAPISAIMTSNAGGVFSAFGGGALKVRGFDGNTPSTFGMGSPTNSYSPACLGGGFDRSGSTVRFYYATWSWGGQPTVFRADWTGSALGGGASLGTIPETMSDSSALVRRVEFVKSLGSQGALACVGTHDFVAKVSTLRFYLLTGGSAVRLMQHWQYRHGASDAYSSWHQCCRWAAFGGAIEVVSGTGTVVFNCHPQGAPAGFVLHNGVESELFYPVPVTSPDATIRFTPTGMARLGGNVVLSGYFDRKSSDGTMSVRVEGYLTSGNGKNFSVGEFSSFVTSIPMRGVIPEPISSCRAFVCVGGGYSFRANARTMDSTAVPATSIVPTALTLDSSDNGTDSLSLEVQNANTYKEGNILDVLAGFYDNSGNPIYANLGWYAVDQVPTGLDVRGAARVGTLKALDLATWRIKQWASPVDFDFWTATRFDDPLRKPNKSIHKTPIRSVRHNDKSPDLGMHHTGLNDPSVLYSTSRDDRDGIARATVRFGNHDGRALSGVALIIGAGPKEFTACYIPAANSWTGYTQDRPVVCVSDLDPNKGWTITRHSTGLLRSSLTGNYRTILKPCATTEYIHNPAWTAELNKRYEFVLRKFGAELQLFVREVDYNQTVVASKADMTMVMRWRYPASVLAKYGDYWGIACGTDVWVQEGNNFAGEFEDALISLTSAGENHAIGDFSKFIKTGQRDGGNAARVNFVGSVDMFCAGQTVRTYHTADGTTWLRTIAEVGANYVICYNHRTTTFANFPATGDIQFFALGDSTAPFGTTRSGYQVDTVQGVTVVTDPGGSKSSRRMWGRAAIISDDSTAISPRFGRFDGINFHSLSGSTYIDGGGMTGGAGKSGGTFECWDVTHPMHAPRSWRLLFPHGYFFDGLASQHGLPTVGYFMVGDEVVRYAPLPYYNKGAYPSAFGTKQYVTQCPVWIAPLKAHPGPTSQLFNKWFSSSNKIAGDDLGRIGDVSDVYEATQPPAGLLVEVLGRNAARNFRPDQVAKEYRVTSVTQGANTNDNNTSYVTINPAYENEVIGPGTQGGDIIKVSGRAQLGTKKEGHLATDYLVYYPAVNHQPLGTLIHVTRWGYFAGCVQTVEDALIRTCNLIGIHSATADSAFEHNGGFSGAVSAGTHFNAVVTAYGTFGTTNAWNVQFRGAYHIWTRFNTDGTLTTMIHFPSHGGITPSGGFKKVERVTIPVSSLSGFASSPHKLRVIAHDGQFHVELDDQPVWTFNVDAYEGLISQGAPGGLLFGFMDNSGNWVGGPSLNVKVSALGDDLENHPIDLGASGDAALGHVLSERHIWSRPTANGGIRWTRWANRANYGTISGKLVALEVQSASTGQPAHVVMEGLETADYLDEEWIQQNGYRFAVGNNRLLNTASDAMKESEFLVREGKAGTLQGTVEAVAHPRLEPGDLVTLAVPAVGDIGSYPATEHVVTTASIRMQIDSARGIITVKRKP